MSRVERVNGYALGGLVLLGLGVLAASATAADDAGFVRVARDFSVNQPAMFVGDEFIVVLTREARGAVGVGVDRQGFPTVNIPGLQDVIDRQGVTRFVRQFPTARPQPVGGKFHDLTGNYKAKIAPGVDLDTAMAAFARNPNIDHVEKIGIHPVYYCATGTPSTPNDTYYDDPPPTFPYPQWDLWDKYGIDADLAWTDQTGDESVVVVAMDTGVRYFHKDLGGNDPPGPADNVTDGNVWVNPYEIPGNGIDDEGNGKIDDVVGWDFVDGVTGCSSGEDCSTQDNDPRDFYGHGTHTAGTMAAITNNARGVAGIAGGWGDGTTSSAGNGSKIMCMRIGWGAGLYGYVRMDFAAQAMAYVTDMKTRGVNVAAVNASWGSSNSGGIDAAVDNLLAADVMLIHSAGNSPTGNPDYLGGKAGVMNVAATDQNGYKASFSNYGSWVDIAAPGVDIISTYHNSADPANDYVAVMDGTSMAAPHVVGVAGLLESCDSTLSGPDKFSIMVNNGCPANSPNIGDILNAKLSLDAVPGGCGCTTNEDCDDGNECTEDLCVEGACQNNPYPDDTPCTGGVCCGGTCTPIVCSVGTDCDDFNECTTDTCTNPDTCSAACSNTPVADDTLCSGGVCCGGTCTAIVCSVDGDCDDGNECTTDMCTNPDTCSAACSNTPVADDTPCTGGVCCSGTCTAPACWIDTDCDDAEPCTTDTCVDAGTCTAYCDNTWAACGPADGCCGPTCTPATDPDCTNCGNGTCEPGEDCNNCPDDCISGTGGAVCGNGLCEAGDGEDCNNCPEDCNGLQTGKPDYRFCCGATEGCGDPRCNESGWACTTTPQGVAYCCGDGVCEGAEDYTNCYDCPEPYCGDGSCDPGEDQCNCPEDCGDPPPTETNCTDGIDNDCDGLTDMEDPDCECTPSGEPCTTHEECCSGSCHPVKDYCK